MRHVYFDEAGIGNPHIEPYTVVAGVMLDVDQQYDSIQNYLLDMADDLVAPNLERPVNFAFHAKELWHGEGFFPRENWTLAKRLEILGHLADIPVKFDLPIIYSCVQRSEYPPSSLPDGSPKRLLGKARAAADKKCHTVCFLSCLSQTERFMRQAYKGEKVFVVVEQHEEHRKDLLAIAQLLSNPRARGAIANDPGVNWPALTQIVEEPLFVRKSGSSPVQIADVCSFILARALAQAEHSGDLLEKIRPALVSGFLKRFVERNGQA